MTRKLLHGFKGDLDGRLPAGVRSQKFPEGTRKEGGDNGFSGMKRARAFAML